MIVLPTGNRTFICMRLRAAHVHCGYPALTRIQ
jgi:hypothetical protein